jgi:hypothetical protein
LGQERHGPAAYVGGGDVGPSFADRVLGCVLAGAAGDALGAAVEFQSIDEIRAQYGADGLSDLSLITVWYALHGHAPDDALVHRARARWYTSKIEPSYGDMAIKLRRVIIAARFRSPRPDLATPEQTRAVLAARAAAGT